MTPSGLAPSSQQAALARYLNRRKAMRLLGGTLLLVCAIGALGHYALHLPYAGRVAQAALIGSALLLYLMSNSLCANCSRLFTVGDGDWITHAFTRTCRHCGLHLNGEGAAMIDMRPED